MAGKFEIKKFSDNQFRFNRKAGNGEIILTSKSYKAKSRSEQGIASLKTNAPIDSKYESKVSTSNQPFFVLKAANGEPIGRSDMYSSTSAMENGIESVKRNAPGATVEDLI